MHAFQTLLSKVSGNYRIGKIIIIMGKKLKDMKGCLENRFSCMVSEI